MEEFKNKLETALDSQQQVVKLYRAAIAARKLSPNDSAKIAILAFDTAHPMNLRFDPSSDLEGLRFELGALEAPGDFSTYPSQNFNSQEQFEDFLWERFNRLVETEVVI